MNKILGRILPVLFLLAISGLAVFGQTTGAIVGTVADSNGAVVSNATVVIKNVGSGQSFTVTTNEGGNYRVPALGSGFYTVTVTANGFKKSVVEDVKVDVGTPATADVTLEAGDVTATVVVTGGAEVLQTQTPTVGSTITGRQITEIPLSSRDALDIVTLLPGTAQVGRPRASTINGLPKGALSITIDGADAANPLLKSQDGFFTYVRPRLDAIEEVTVSTAAGGSDSGGDGAVQIKFVTTRGTNQYKGGLYWHHRNTALNSGYFFDNRDRLPDPETGKAPRTRALLNQFGGKFGGPLPFPQFGEGGKVFNSGKDRAFFFTNYEEFRLPEAASRTRVLLTPTAQAGTFRYITGGTTQTVNLLNLLSANGFVSTVDPTIGSLLGQIRTAASSGGSITPISNDLNRENFNFSSNANQVRKFFTLRLDFNLTKNHSLENVTNYQVFRSSIDILNNADNSFPGFPNFGGQDSDRYTNTTALRSNFGANIINEARFSYLGGPSDFRGSLSLDSLANQGGFNLGLNTAFGITNATAGGANAAGFSAAGNSDNRRTEETFSFADNVTWLAGNHTITFGGEYKFFRLSTSSRNQIAPNISLGLDATDPINGLLTVANFPGASTAQLAQAGGLISLLIGRVNAVNGTAFLKDDQTYGYLADQTQTSEQSVYGLYLQDSWRIRPNLGLNFGVRWQPQGPFVTTSKNFAAVSDFNDVFGVSGANNLFKPGTLTGKVPTFIGTDAGYEAFKTDYNNFAPSVGIVWSPNLGKILGRDGKSVIRAGYSNSFVREGSFVVLSILGSNPGGLIDATKSVALGNLPVGTLLRNRADLAPPTFAASPNYPLAGTVNDSTNAFDPNLRTGMVHSWNLSYQRELTKDTVFEIRYVGNRGVDLWRQYNINELNSIENGFANEFRLAQANLLANNAAGGARAGSFAFFGAGTGTNPLPIIQSYFRGVGDPTVSAQYTSTLYRNATVLSRLSANAPNVLGLIGDIDGNAGRRANALAAGLPVNFFRVNPTTRGGSFVVDNSTQTAYDSAVLEVRRRFSNGFLIQGSYTFSKAMSDFFGSSAAVANNFVSLRDRGLNYTNSPFDVRHAFKANWVYELPVGKGKWLLGDSNGFVNHLVGGWSVFGSVKLQSGTPINFGNVQLIGMTREELQREIRVRKGATVVTYLPDDIILNTQKAFDINVANANGYGTTFGTGGPTGRFIAPAGFGNCVQRFTGECGFSNLVVYGPRFFKTDISLAKKIKLTETKNFDLRANFLNAFNTTEFRVGGWVADVVNIGAGGATFGQLGNGTVYQDTSTTNDPGGRVIEIVLRFNF
jgi:hypothetical protein